MNAKLEKARDFLSAINKKVGIYVPEGSANLLQDKGAMAVLKRGLTGESKHLRAAAPILLPHIKSDSLSYEWQFVACLFAYYPQPLVLKNTHNFGLSLRQLNDLTDSNAEIKGPERRLRALLNMSREDLHTPFTSLVRLIKSKSQKGAIAIDYPRLIVDLCYWDSADQFVQDQWARSFWRAPSTLPSRATPNTDSAE